MLIELAGVCVAVSRESDPDASVMILIAYGCGRQWMRIARVQRTNGQGGEIGFGVVTERTQICCTVDDFDEVRGEVSRSQVKVRAQMETPCDT